VPIYKRKDIEIVESEIENYVGRFWIELVVRAAGAVHIELLNDTCQRHVQIKAAKRIQEILDGR